MRKKKVAHSDRGVWTEDTFVTVYTGFNYVFHFFLLMHYIVIFFLILCTKFCHHQVAKKNDFPFPNFCHFFVFFAYVLPSTKKI